MNIFNKVLSTIKYNRDKLLSGGYNVIPWNLPRFQRYLPGIEQGKYYCVTANQKVGKSQLTDFLFVFNPYHMIKSGIIKNVKYRVLYFSLELSKEAKMTQFVSNTLFIKSNGILNYDINALSSLKNPIPDTVLQKLDDYKDYIGNLEKYVRFIDHCRSADHILNYIDKDLEKHPKQEDEWIVVIVDHAGLLESNSDADLRNQIGILSKGFVSRRNDYKITPVLIQQQTSSQESLDNFKANKLKPSANGLGENKTTGRDFDVILGIFSPIKHDIPEYLGYDIKLFKDNIRFLEIVEGRFGGTGITCPLYFDGRVTYFKELPIPNTLEYSAELERINKLKSYIDGT